MNIIKIKRNDTAFVKLNIGNLPSSETDIYVNKIMEKLKDIFKCEIAVFPVRDGESDITIIRNKIPRRKKL